MATATQLCDDNRQWASRELAGKGLGLHGTLFDGLAHASA
jgi:hypothetical protein